MKNLVDFLRDKFKAYQPVPNDAFSWKALYVKQGRARTVLGITVIASLAFWIIALVPAWYVTGSLAGAIAFYQSDIELGLFILLTPLGILAILFIVIFMRREDITYFIEDDAIIRRTLIRSGNRSSRTQSRLPFKDYYSAENTSRETGRGDVGIIMMHNKTGGSTEIYVQRQEYDRVYNEIRKRLT